MSKEHAYAYEAGYRDGSIHYELEHCPACKNVADLQEALAENAMLREELKYERQTSRSRLERIDQLKAENAKLREDLEFANNEWEKESIEFLNLQAENAKLRELVADMWFWHYEGHIDSESQERQMLHIDAVIQRMRELGLEVDDA